LNPGYRGLPAKPTEISALRFGKELHTASPAGFHHPPAL